MKLHKLNVTSEHDAMAGCSCGHWTYSSPGKIDMDRVTYHWRLHAVYAAKRANRMTPYRIGLLLESSLPSGSLCPSGQRDSEGSAAGRAVGLRDCQGRGRLAGFRVGG